MADKLVALLNGLGYQPVFARVGLRPPRLYTYERTKRGLVMQLRGELSAYLAQGTKVPPSRSQPMASAIEAQSTSGKDLKGSVDFLRRALACIGIETVPKLELAFAGSKDLKFSLTDLEAIVVEPAAIEPLLPGLDLGRIPPELLTDGKAYIAYEYLAASTVVLERGDEKAFDTKLEGKLGEFVDVGQAAKVEVKDGSKLSFQGKDGKRAVFATKVGRIDQRKDGRYLALDDGIASGSGQRIPVIPKTNAVLLMVDDLEPA
jgi:hypothetical protein